MTVSRRKNKPVTKVDDKSAAESGVQYHCDVCGLDISSTVRISCATCENQPGALDTYDLCCCCFLEGAESGTHKAFHDYRVVEQHAYPIFCNDWGADEELLLIDGCQIYGLGNWADIADHIGNRTKEEVEDHYVKTFIEGRDGTSQGDVRAQDIVRNFLSTRTVQEAKAQQLPVAGPNVHYKSDIDAEEFQRRKRQRIENLRQDQAAFGFISASQSSTLAAKPIPPKPLVSAPTSHSELAGFMPGRLEFETEYEQEAENYVKDMEFGKVYKYGGEAMPSEMEALGGKAEKGKSRMEASGRGGPSLGSRGATKATKAATRGGTIAQSKEVEGSQAGDREKGESDDEEKDDAEEEDAEKEETEEVEEEEEEEGEKEEEEDGEGEGDEDDVSAMDVDATQTVLGGNEDAPIDQSSKTSMTKAVAIDQSAPPESDERAPDWDEDDADLNLKLIVLNIYNERLDRRGRRKEFIFGRNLIDYKRNIAAERKRPKEEREILNRVRHFAQMQNAIEFEEFCNGLCYEDALRRMAAQLQMYRRAGITNLTDANKFDTEQAERARKAIVAAEGGLAAFPLGGSLPRSASGRNAREITSTIIGADDSLDSVITNHNVKTLNSKKSNGIASSDEKKPVRKPPKPLDLSQHPSLNLLTRAEQELCSIVRIQPQAFMIMKKEIIIEYVRRKGRFTRRESRVLFKCDVNKVGKVYDLLESEGYLREAARLGGEWDGMGTPPGWIEKPPPPTLDSIDKMNEVKNSVLATASHSGTSGMALANGNNLEKEKDSSNEEDSSRDENKDYSNDNHDNNSNAITFNNNNYNHSITHGEEIRQETSQE